MPRYIDADKLIERVNCKRYRKYHTCKGCEFFDERDSWCNGELFGVQIMDAPAEDVAPVTHAHWDYPFNRDIAKCSVCDFCVQDKINNVAEMYKYCPNCGARMDEEEE